MPQDLKDYLPDFDRLLKETDRAEAEQKYREAVQKAAEKAAAEAALPSARAPRRMPVAEPPPTTVPIAKPRTVRNMPRWKLALFAVVFATLPAAVGILVVRSVRPLPVAPAGTDSSSAGVHVNASGGGAGAMPSASVIPSVTVSAMPSVTVSATPSAIPSVEVVKTGASGASVAPSVTPSTTTSVKPAPNGTSTKPLVPKGPLQKGESPIPTNTVAPPTTASAPDPVDPLLFK